MNVLILGLTISSAGGNGQAALWRGLCRALHARGHHMVFFERDVPCYARPSRSRRRRVVPAGARARVPHGGGAGAGAGAIARAHVVRRGGSRLKWGIAPVAGHGSRIQPLAFSKALLPVGSRRYIGTLVNAWLDQGGMAAGVPAGHSYVDMGTVPGYREAVLLPGDEAAGSADRGTESLASPDERPLPR